MRLTVTPSGPALLIRSYAEGAVRVGDTAWQSAVLLASGGLQAALRPQSPAELQERDLEPAFAEKPEVVVIGWAGGQTFLPAAQRRWFLERQIGLEIMELGAACRTYNVLMGDGRRVVALLFPRST
ncbi:MAG: Mth938-like domain-containing protein [Gammaproteobacteria bacterium]